jgi:hypothetical protein
MSPEMILIGIVGLAVVLILVRVALKAIIRVADEVALRSEEGIKKLKEAEARLVEAKTSLLEKVFPAGSRPHQMVLPILSSIAATATAVDDPGNDIKFQFALSKWRKMGAPPFPMSSTNEQDVKIYLRVFHSIMQTINEPDWISRFRDQLRDLEAGGFLRLSKEGKQDVQKLIELLKPGAASFDDDYRHFVELLDSALLHSTM